MTAALNRQWPDKTPIVLHNFLMAAAEAGVSMAKYRSDAKALASCFIQAVETYQYDAILIDVDTAMLAGAVGVHVDYPDDQPGRCHQPLLDDLKKVGDLRKPRVAEYPTVVTALEAVGILRDYFHDEIFIRGNCDQCPFSLASMIRSPQQWLMDLIDADQADVHALLEYCTEVTGQFITAMHEVGAHCVSNGDSPAGPELVSPAMYREFALPYEKRIADLAHSYNRPYILHICGNTDAILDDMVATGSDGLELDYKTNAALAREKLDGKVAFVGNIDPTGVLVRGSVKDVEDKTRRLLEVFADTPRFILNAGCAIPPSTPPENLRAMIRVARQFR